MSIVASYHKPDLINDTLKHDTYLRTDMNILSIGGSDPSSGAGIQSDIKTFSNYNVYGFTAVTAITSQNTRKVSQLSLFLLKA